MVIKISIYYLIVYIWLYLREKKTISWNTKFLHHQQYINIKKVSNDWLIFRFGRRWTLVFHYILGGILCMSTAAVPLGNWSLGALCFSTGDFQIIPLRSFISNYFLKKSKFSDERVSFYFLFVSLFYLSLTTHFFFFFSRSVIIHENLNSFVLRTIVHFSSICSFFNCIISHL